MKITGLKVFIVNPAQHPEGGVDINLTFVKVYTDEGIDGLGEGFSNGKARTVEAAAYEFERWLKGKDPTEILRHWYAYYRGSRYPQGTETMAALSAIEQALWDISGKAAGLPIYKMLGGPVRDRIRLYRTTAYEGQKEAVDRGFTGVKIVPQKMDFASKHPTQMIADAIERVAEVRDEIGDDVDLALDYHGRSFSPMDAVQFARGVEPYGILFLEEPALTDTPASLAEIKQQTTIPIAGGERVVTRDSLRQVLEHRAVHILQPEPTANGGIFETIKWAAAAELHQIVLAPHHAGTPVSLLACAHIDACVSNFLIQECHIYMDTPWIVDLFDPLPTIEDGYLELPDRPGLGIELNEDAASEYKSVAKDRPVVIQRDGSIGLD